MKTSISSRWHRIFSVPLSVLLMGAGMLISGTASAQSATIVGSVHDFSAQGWNGYDEICVVCHTPHNAYSEAEAGAGAGETGPLWNRTLTAVTNFSVYTDVTRVGSDIQAVGFGQPTGVSKLCLSCHDGTIAIDSFGRAADRSVFTGGTDFMATLNPNANIGEGSGTDGNLSNDHPVAFTFPTTDPELVTITGNVVNGQTTELPLFGATQMECATCHDVHATGTFGPLLRVDNTGSGLCLNCHTK